MLQVTSGGYYVSNNIIRSPERLTHSYELELCTFSDALSIFDEQKYKRIEGSIFLARPGQRRYTIGNYESYYFYFTCDDADFAAKYIDSLPIQIYNVDTYRFTQYMKDVIFLLQNKNSQSVKEYELLMNARLTMILLELYQTAKSQTSSSESSKYAPNISAACQYIAEHFREPMGIEEIAGAAMLSPSFTYSMFKQITGLTPHDFLTNTRIRHACERLIYTSENIGEISLSCGFANPNYLYYVFPRYTGMTPRAYRKFYQKK